MCIFNYIKCFCCFETIDRFTVTLCGNQLTPLGCNLSYQHFIDTQWFCGWCIKLRLHVKNIYVSSIKRKFFQTLNQIHRKPGYEAAIYQKLKNQMYNPIIPENYKKLCQSPNLDSCYLFNFLLFESK